MAPQPRFEILPRVGIGPVFLGMTRGEVEAALASIPGAPPRRPKGKASRIDCYFQASLQVEFGDADTASFIEVSNPENVLCLYKGADVFDLAAPELFALFAADDRAGPHTFNPREYLFPGLIVALWDADEQYDQKGAETRPVYACVGVGGDEYLRAIQAMHSQRSAGRQ